MTPVLVRAISFCLLVLNTLFTSNLNAQSLQSRSDVEIWIDSSFLNPDVEQTHYLETLGSTALKKEGLSISTQGGRGQPTQFFLDGSDSGDLVVLVDGFRLTDAGSPARSFDFNLMETDAVGVQPIRANSELLSVGSGGAFGAVELMTKIPQAKPQASFKQIVGGNQTFSETLTFEGGSQKSRNFVRVSRYDSNEISAADEDLGNSEKDSHRYTSILFKNYQLHSDRFQTLLGVSGKFSSTDLDRAGLDGLPVEDENYQLNRTALRGFGKVQLKSAQRWSHTLRVQAFQNDREYSDRITASDPVDMGSFSFEGQTFDGGIENKVALSENHNFYFGTSYLFERMQREGFDSFKSRAAEWNPYLRNKLRINRQISLGVGASGSVANGSEGAFVYRADAKYEAREIRTDFEVGGGTGIKRPSLFQRFDPLYGEAGLNPQRDTTVRFKARHYFPKDLGDISLEPYWKTSSEVIAFDFGNLKYLNRDQNEFFGGALALGIQPEKNTRFTSRFSVLSKSFDRRARHQWKQALERVWFKQKLRTSLNFQWVGVRSDFDGSTLSAYRVFDIHASYRVSNSIELLATLMNVGNEDYEISKGYGVYGRTFFAGLEARL